ncbi:MAG: 3-oxoacyl-ACP reductase FabG [Burkholderiales bacterium]
MLEGKVALVTGASRGIGKEIALALARAGAMVAATSTSDAGAQGIDDFFRAEKLQGMGCRLDVKDAGGMENTLATMESRFGPPSILVNNAGITRDNLMLRMKESEWDDIMDTNLKSVFRLSKLVLRQMVKARFGRIVNITSVVGFVGNPGQANYAAAKAGIVGFSKSLAREVGSRNVTVNCIAPGFIDTDMTRALPDEQKTALLNQVPLGRFGSAKEIAAAVLFLVSESAGYITGSTLHVNGGMYMD